MNENISFVHLKTVIKTKGLSLASVAEMCGKKPTDISNIATNRRIPKTDLLAKICSVLGVYPSEVVAFGGIKVNENFFTNDKRQPLPNEFEGAVTYKPMWMFLDDYLADWNRSHPGEKQKTAKDLFDGIEPPRRVSGIEPPSRETMQKARDARFGEGYKAEKEYRRTDYSKGLPAETRTKLRNDRPLNLSVIYEICKKLGCTIDFVMSYK